MAAGIISTSAIQLQFLLNQALLSVSSAAEPVQWTSVPREIKEKLTACVIGLPWQMVLLEKEGRKYFCINQQAP